MRKICGVWVGVAVLTCGVLAQGVPTPEIQVPAIREPHHFVKLDNKYVRVLDVTVAAVQRHAVSHPRESVFLDLDRCGDAARPERRRQRDRQHRAGRMPRCDTRRSSRTASATSDRRHFETSPSRFRGATMSHRPGRFWPLRSRPAIRRNRRSTTSSCASSG